MNKINNVYEFRIYMHICVDLLLCARPFALVKVNECLWGVIILTQYDAFPYQIRCLIGSISCMNAESETVQLMSDVHTTQVICCVMSRLP